MCIAMPRLDLLVVSLVVTLGCGARTGLDSASSTSGSQGTVQALSASSQGACALVDGSMYCWGGHLSMELADAGLSLPTKTPTKVAGLAPGVTAIAEAYGFDCAVVEGRAYCRGNNEKGQLGDGTTNARSEPVAVVGLEPNVTSVSASGMMSSHACAIVNNAAYCWGSNSLGQLGDGTTNDSTVPRAVIGMTSGVAAIDTGGEYTCAINNGAAYCWGSNTSGQLGGSIGQHETSPVPVMSLSSGVTAIAAGDAHTCAIVNGDAFCWGNNWAGQLGNSSYTATEAYAFVRVTGLAAGVTAISAGYQHTCAVASGSVYCWGDNNYGQSGHGQVSTTPTLAFNAESAATAVVAGDGFSCAITKGRAYCWGDNFVGELGNGTTEAAQGPVAVHLP